MPGAPATLTLTGPSSTSGFPIWFPDPNCNPFDVGITVVGTSSASGVQTYNIEYTNDYQGQFSSNFNGWISSNANWFAASSQFLGAVSSTPVSGSVNFPVTAFRINMTTGTSVDTVTAKFIQAG